MSDTLGFIGTGRFGFAICERLVEKKQSLCVYNRTVSKARELAKFGANVMETPRQVAERAGIVFLCLASESAVEDVLWQKHEGLTSAGRHIAIVETSTVSAAFAESTERRLAEVGIGYVACSLSGGTVGARQGTLTAIIGGRPDCITTVRPALACITTDCILAANPAMALTLKILNNMAEAINLCGAAEVNALARRLGVPNETAARVFRSARGRSAYMDVMLEYLETGKSGATTAIRLKDIELALQMAAGAGLSLPVADRTKAAFERVHEAYGPEADQCNCFDIIFS